MTQPAPTSRPTRRPDEPTLVSTPIASLTTDVTVTAVESVSPSAGPALLRSAGIVAAAFVASRLLGLVREVIVASRFGTEGDASAYVAAFRIPDLLFLIIMAGSFGSAFVPVFAGFLGRGDEDRAWRLASAVLTWSVLAVAVLAILAFILAGPLTSLMVGGLDPEYQRKTVNLMRLLLLSPIFLGLGIAAKGILEAQDLYLFPALSPLVYNLGIILGGLLLSSRYGIYAFGIGVVAGAIGHLAIQIPAVLRSGLRFRPTLNPAVEGLGTVWSLLLPRVLGQAAFQINFIVVTRFAGSIDDGSIAGLNYAWQLLMLPHGVLALSISTVIFPSLSRMWDQGRTDEVRSLFLAAIRPLLFLSIPASVGLFAFRESIVRVLLEFGDFDRDSTALVAGPLAYFAIGLVGYALVEALTRVFYAMRDTVTPVIAGVSTIVVNVVLCALFVGPLGVSGLALSLSLTTFIEGVILIVVLLARLGLRQAGLGYWLFQVTLATAVMVGFVAALAGPVGDAIGGGTLSVLGRTALLGAAVAFAGLTYGCASVALGIPELGRVGRPLWRRVQSLAARFA
ncbi:MAG: murein biosynthesis integral membrane protein MurJ [Thermomicrobiales bacterium]